MDQETLDRIEMQRLELESNVASLRKSLRHWQTLEIEYEGLKEEFQGLPEDASGDDCLQAARDFRAELVDDNELQAIIGKDSRHSKRPSQLVDIFSKRVDYVLRNVTTIRNQLKDAEKKRNALLLAKEPEYQDAAALPLGEIIEELDDDGNVISSKVQTPGKDTNDLLDVLRKAGVPGIEPGEDMSEMKPILANSAPKKSTDQVAVTSSSTELPDSSVHTEHNHIANLLDEDDIQVDKANLGPTNPNDSEEDAALRQEMLHYGLGEVGTIVAELDLEDSGNLSDDDDEDYLSDYDEDEDLYTDESEDDVGATKNPVISDRYKRQMEALSQKHGITDLTNLGPESEIPKDTEEQLMRPSAAEAARRAAIEREEAAQTTLKSSIKDMDSNTKPQKKKKTVAFSPQLDFSKEPPNTPSPLGDTVIERPTDRYTSSSSIVAPETPRAPAPITTKKQSRFKAARTATPQTPLYPPPMTFPPSSSSTITPTGPPNQTIASTLIERPTTSTAPPTSPSDFNDELHRREVAVEYQKMRNRRIHEQGGYVAGGDDENYGEEIVPLEDVDEVTGKVKKVSRFKAARLKSGQGDR